MPHRQLNAFTVDVEDYYHVSTFEKQADRADWGRYESRVVASTRRILAMLDRHQTRGTFFVLGWVADRHPELVREIHALGHEIGTHSYWHRLVYEQTPDEFREDLRRSKQVLEDITGVPVTSHRAPSFSITRKSLWALEILVEEGIRIDSSVFPTRHDRYGIPEAQPRIHPIETPSGCLWEFPLPIVNLPGLNFPVGGGGYFRLYPLWLTLACLKRINRAGGRPFVVYAHPWEVDPDQPRLPIRSPLSRFRQYVNLSKTASRLDALLQKFSFGRISDAVKATETRPSRVCDPIRLDYYPRERARPREAY